MESVKSAFANAFAKRPTPESKMIPADMEFHPAKFQLVSDLHFESNARDNEYKTYLTRMKVTAPYLILAGDIGVPSNTQPERFYVDFLKQCCKRYQQVFLIAGNSEYQTTMTVPQTDKMMKKWERQMSGKLHVLSAGFTVPLVDHNIVVLGCTLWSRIKDNHGLSDGRHLGGGTNSVEAHNSRHKRDLEWIKGEVESIRTGTAYRKDTKILIITHHAPTISGSNQPERDGRGPNWSNFQSDILGGEGVDGLREGDIWVFGHTHFSNDFKQDEVRVISNQRGGCRNDNNIAKTHYDPAFAFEM